MRVLELARTRSVVIECSPFLQTDPLYQELVVARLAAMGLCVSAVTLDAAEWLPMARKRLYVAAFADAAHFDAYWGVSRPVRRELKYANVLLPP